MQEWISSGWLSGDSYDAHRAEDVARFLDAAATDLAAHVPTCPDWDVAALCDHLARVYQGRGFVIANRAFAAPGDFVTREEGADPLAWVRRWSDRLDEVLAGLPDDAPTVTFMPGADEVLFWRRRMALETLVHRTDAELAVGRIPEMDDELSADGVEELLWFLTHPEMDHDDGMEATSVVELTDGSRVWSIALSDAAAGLPDAGEAPQATVRGSAPALLLALSGRDLDRLGAARFGVEAPHLEGDETAYRRLLTRLGEF